MKLVLERPGRNEPDLELVWLMVLAATGIMAIAWLTFPLQTPACAFRELTGFPCPTCGGTRCIRSLLAGHFGAAFTWNPLVFLLAAAAAAYGLYAGTVLALRLPRIRLRGAGNALRLGIALVVAVNWLYLVREFSQQSPDPTRKHGLTVSWVAQ